MTDARMKRRMAGFLGKRLAEVEFEAVPDNRDRRGRRWQLGDLLRASVIGMAAGAQSLAEVESVTRELTLEMRRLVHIERRVPDTTLRDALVLVSPESLRQPLHRAIKAAYRRHALDADVLPIGVVALDGKWFTVPSSDDYYSQRQTRDDDKVEGRIRTTTAVLTSSRARPCIDITPIPASTNEMGYFNQAFMNLVTAYKGIDLFRMVSYDAGACSAENARLVRSQGVHYLFGLKGNQPTLLAEARLWLSSRTEPDAMSEDLVRGERVIRRAYIGSAETGPDGWEHIRTVLRITSETLNAQGEVVKSAVRYFISSLPTSRLTHQQWLQAVRDHWSVEIAHQMLDVSLKEDARPFIKENPRATVVVAILRRITYTLLALFRSVTQRSEFRRNVPWKDLLELVKLTLVTANATILAGLRRHCTIPVR
jgi:DDE_Tnp_1-associated/Transposase DDE domain